MNRSKIIELWKNDCPDCEAANPIVEELEKEGYEIEKHNITDPDGMALWEEYEREIDQNSRRMGYETGYIYTPAFINPQTRRVLAYENRPPTKDELVRLAASSKM